MSAQARPGRKRRPAKGRRRPNRGPGRGRGRGRGGKRGPANRRPTVSPAAHWREKHADTGAEVWTVLPSNLPDHAAAPAWVQRRWIRKALQSADVVTVAEAHRGLLKSGEGLHVEATLRNFGGRGNLIATRLPGRDSHYTTTYEGIFGREFTLHMQRRVMRKGETEATVDAIHAPARGRKYQTASTDEERAGVIRAIARQKAPTAARVISGDFNWEAPRVLAALRAVDDRWIYLGGAGVEQVYGIGVDKLDDPGMSYGWVSDHKITARVKFGVHPVAA